jgi:hypothetical protein
MINYKIVGENGLLSSGRIPIRFNVGDSLAFLGENWTVTSVKFSLGNNEIEMLAFVKPRN